MWKPIKAAVYTGTKNLYKAMVPAVKSLVCNSDVDKIYLFIEDDKFPYEVPEDIVEVRNVSKQKYFKPDGPNMNSKFTYMAMIRAALAHELDNLDRVLSLDVDTLVVRDIQNLWHKPIENGFYFAAVEEPQRTRSEGYLYTNIGVALYNLEMLRDGKCDEVIEALNTKEYRFLEQDVFNELCQEKILPISNRYNSNPFCKVHDIPSIVHFAGVKYWQDENEYEKWDNASWDEIMKYRKRVYNR